MSSCNFYLIYLLKNSNSNLIFKIYQLSDEFLTNLNKSNDIDEILEMHKNFLQKMTQSLSQGKFISKEILEIFDITLRFCDRWTRGIYAININLVKEFENEINTHFNFISYTLSAAIKLNQLSHLQPLISVLLYTTK